MNIQRKFGALTIKGGGNDAKVQVLLDDFEQADKCLNQLIDAVKQWRDAWRGILTGSFDIADQFEGLYNPIVGVTNGNPGNGYDTTDEQLRRTVKLKEAYDELRKDLMEEVNMMDDRIIAPATEAREYIKPMRKVLKKRDDKRLDFERYEDRVNHAVKKGQKSERDTLALQKAQEELSKATDTFRMADDHVREVLPPLIQACFSLLPHLLAAQIMTQNTLLAQYYTILHTYCGEEGFPSTPPAMEEVISSWSVAFKPIQTEAEALSILAHGKAVHSPMSIGEPQKGSSMTGMNLRNNFAARRASSQNVIPSMSSKPSSPGPGRISRIPSSNSTSSLALARRDEYEQDEDPRNSRLSPGPVAAAFASRPPSGPGTDYFQIVPKITPATRRPSAISSISNGSNASSLASSIAVKKKPPPPPPKPKRIASHQNEIYVVAMYGFDGQEAGDLSFGEGERIRVTKKTERADDWWEGELNGQRGKFPANYCELMA